MGYHIDAGGKPYPYLQIRDVDSDAVRLVWYHPIQAVPADDPLARALAAEEALHGLFKRLFLLAAEQRLGRGASAVSAAPRPAMRRG